MSNTPPKPTAPVKPEPPAKPSIATPVPPSPNPMPQPPLDATPPVEGAVPFPPHPDTLKGTPREEIIRIWATQAKKGTITLCTCKKGDDFCYYPVNPVRDPQKSNDIVFGVDKHGKKYMLATCSFAGEKHGEQRIYPPKKEDEI